MASGIARSGWDIDLRDGEAREDAFVHTFLKAKVEHKSDEKCRFTGNVFIEFRQKGRPSGIAVSTADYWAIEFNTNCWIVIPTDKLRHLARQYWKAGKVKNGGDGDNYEGILIPLTALIQVGNVMPGGKNV